MRITNGIVASMVTVALAVGAGALADAAAPVADAATVACGGACMAIGPEEYGLSYVTAVSGGAVTGQGIHLAKAAESASEDFMLRNEGTVAALYKDGLIGASLRFSWPSDEVYEYAYAPDGVASSLCVGVASTATQGAPVSLQPCGSSPRVLWIALSADSIGGFEPLINGSDANDRDPYVLTAGRWASGLTVEQLVLTDGMAATSQIWASWAGVYYPSRQGATPVPTRR